MLYEIIAFCPYQGIIVIWPQQEMIRRQIQFLVLEGKYVRFFRKDSGDRSAKQLALGKVYQNLWDGGRLIGGGGILDASRGGRRNLNMSRRGGQTILDTLWRAGPKNFRLDFFNVCGNNLYVVLGYYRHFWCFEFRGAKEFGRVTKWGRQKILDASRRRGAKNFEFWFF